MNILHLSQVKVGSFSRRLTTNFALTIIISFFKTLHDLNFTLTINNYHRNFCEKGCCLL